jgi:hypothetical protein
MIVTYLRDKDKYVSETGRQVTSDEYGKNFYKCKHDFKDIGKRGETIGANGKKVPAKALKCSKCAVFTIIEVK